jgi:hypothetical protein
VEEEEEEEEEERGDSDVIVFNVPSPTIVDSTQEQQILKNEMIKPH